MPKKLSITYNGQTFREGDKIRMKTDCGKVHKDEIYPLVNKNKYGVLYAHNAKYDGWCSCEDKWQLLSKKPTQPRTSNGRFAGKEENTIVHRPALNSVWKDTIKESEHPWGMRVTETLIEIGGAYDLNMTPLAAKDLQKKLQLALERHKLLFNQEKE